jgi:hypothetical protein
MSAKHTPGPWQAIEFFSPPKTFYILDSQGRLIVGVANKICKEDAQLISAAPDLLWALNQAIAYLANPQAFDTDKLGKDWMALKSRIEKQP